MDRSVAAFRIRAAVAEDADGISTVLSALEMAGKRNLPSDAEFVGTNYIGHPRSVSCLVAVNANGTILGLQSLKQAWPGNPYGVQDGWGIIGTHISPDAARRGVGRALFAATRRAARDAGMRSIDASIGRTSDEGLAYYEAMGFRTYRTSRTQICKCYDLASDD